MDTSKGAHNFRGVSHARTGRLSGTRVREMVQRIELPLPEDCRCEGAAILLRWATPALDSPEPVGHT